MADNTEVRHVVSASREIAAPAEQIFELIADPSQQPQWDGNDNLAEAPTAQRPMHGLLMRRLSRSRGRPADAGRLIAAAEPTVTSWTVRELWWVSMYDEVRDDERRRVIEEICPNAPSYVSLLRGIDVALWMAAAP